ncbi:metal-dependent hydrolase [Betaproteobacteria bacterium]|nr:metal-dependent hydrolase [Betaproteobacteria bacterium]GHT99047.1 metal-dependent hydrolase [Betaproteobacteria bacterium]GHU22460.1 metal-dependent hydrolase [Betaproteobacteria bacterium]
MKRRHFLMAVSGLALAGAAGMSAGRWHRPYLLNPCRSTTLPQALAASPWLARTWQGLDPARVWDCHVHIAGIGDGDEGVKVGPKLDSVLHPKLYAQRLFYMNAGCVATQPGTVDENYVLRMATQVAEMPVGVKLMLFAFDWFHDERGEVSVERSTFFVANDYARRVAAAHPAAFEWVASIHPYRADALDQLEAAAAQGARAVKWLPAAQNIDPASARCDAFYAALARLDLPLISHCGEEKAVQSSQLEPLGNPLRLRRAMAAGVRVVVAHCATMGEDEDLDQPGRHRPSFELFARLMGQAEWKDHLHGDISAILLRNRRPDVIKTLLVREDWHGRLLNGSDYPLPGILPLMSPKTLATAGLLPKAAVPDLELLREHNPVYFDLALKRTLSWQGKSFSPQVFATRDFFDKGQHELRD